MKKPLKVLGIVVGIGVFTLAVIALVVFVYSGFLRGKAIERMTALCSSQKPGAVFDYEKFSGEVKAQHFAQFQPEKNMRPAADDELVIRKMFPGASSGGTSCHVVLKKALVEKASVVSVL